MGRSMSIASVELPHNASSSAEFTNGRLNRKFAVYPKDGEIYQSESGKSADGSESFVEANPLKWIIGAGVNGFGAIIQKDNYLFQAPLSFYSESMSWAPSPGYEFADLGFNRPINAGCISCHSGRPNPIPSANGKFGSEPFAELAIGCERCHGPGAAHINAMHVFKNNSAHTDSKLVNPARLSPYLADNICMACHQTGDVRVLRPGKSYTDISPGKPLDETLAIFMVPPTKESPPKDDHVEHYYSMTLSKCYRASQGRMSCITCHDPHVEPSREEAPSYFTKKCLTCHGNQSCKLTLDAKMHQKPANNCIGCHMPKRAIQVISHSSATNHRIVATPDEPFPEITFNQTTKALPDLIHLNAIHNPSLRGQVDSLPLITLLSAYGELSESKPEYSTAYLKVLGQLEKTNPKDPLVQAALGRKDLKNGNLQEAVDHLRGAIESGSQAATTYTDLADALEKSGQLEEVIPLIEKAIAIDPFNPVSRKMLVVNLVATKQYAKAHTVLQSYLETFPQDDFMRQMLARVEGRSTAP